MSSQLLLVVLLTALSASQGAEWSYTGTHGLQSWPNICRNGSHQSPLDVGDMGIQESHFETLALINYFGDRNASVTNNGHAVQLALESSKPSMVTAGGLRGVYYLEQAHFHWPSEHTITGKRYPLELHFVHHNRVFSSVGNALSDSEGVAVLAVLFHESNSANTALNPLIEALPSVSGKAHTSGRLRRTLHMQDLLPADTNTYYRYHGSLTTPGCNEAVVWTVFTETVPIGRQQLHQFRQLRSNTGTVLDFNNRPVQPQNDRIVYFQSGPGPHVMWTFSGSHKAHLAPSIAAGLALLVGFL